jgi:hypothetical protein
MAYSSRLRTANLVMWLSIAVFTALWLVFRFWSPTAAIFRHTYQFPVATPGTLNSQRWSQAFVFEGLYELAWLIPISAAFMIAVPGEPAATNGHVIVDIVLFILYTVGIVFLGINWRNANPITSDGDFANQANDYRLCCIVFNFPQAFCANTAPCTPAVSSSMLLVSGTFLFRFAFNVVILAYLIYDFTITLALFRPAAIDYGRLLREKQVRAEEQLLPPEEEEESDCYIEPMGRRVSSVRRNPRPPTRSAATMRTVDRPQRQRPRPPSVYKKRGEFLVIPE